MKIKWRLIFLLTIFCLAGYLFQTRQINLGLDLQGGTRLVLEAQDTDDFVVDQDTMQGILSVVRNRVNGLGVSEPVIQSKGLRQIVVELPGVKDPERAIRLIGETALLEFAEGQILDQKILGLPEDKRRLIIGDGVDIRIHEIVDSQGTVFEQPVAIGAHVLTGADLKSATPGTNDRGYPVVNMTFTKEGGNMFFELTKRQVGRHIVILLDGKIVSVASVRKPIPGGQAFIEGRFSIEEMRDLVIKLKAGSLPAPVAVISNKIVGPTLGEDSILKSKKAGMIGLILVAVYMLFVYRVSGLVANLALLSYLLFSLSIFKFLGATLTLPGIAGIILTIGMAVDANVIIFGRIRDELSSGHAMRQAITQGFSKGFVAIFDSNVTTLIAAVVLFWLGTGTIKGFAVTLSIGILVSMFTAIFVTKLFLDILSKSDSIGQGLFFGLKERS